MRWVALSALLLVTPAAAEPRLDHYPKMPSHFVAARDVTVFVPDECQAANARCAVVYMMDGQNLFTPSQYSGADWGVAETLPKLIAAGDVPPAIVVGVDNTAERTQEYMPQRVYDLLPADYQARVRAFEDGQPPKSDAYLSFLVTELKPFIDRTYAVKTGPESTSIIGSSMGAHIALYAQGQYPQVFGASASVSMPWLMASPAKDDVRIAADAAVLKTAWAMWLKRTKMRPGRNRIYTDQGTVELDGQFTPYETAIVPVFAAVCWRDGVDFAAPVYEGAKHSEIDWRKRLDVVMRFVLYK